MLVKKEQRKEKRIAKDSVVWEYGTDNKDLGFALARIKGRFPDSGKAMNRICQEIYYVISGNGKLFINDKEVELKEGDVFFIEAGKEYYVVGEDLVLAVPTSPSWYPEQQRLIEK